MSNKLRWILAGIITVAVFGLLGATVWLIVGLSPVDRGSSKSSLIAIKKGVGAPEVANDLKRAGVIRSSSAFAFYVTATGLRRQLQAGTYEFSPSQSAREIARKISRGEVAANLLLVPEGTTILKLRQSAESKGVDPKAFDEALQASYGNDFLKGKPQSTSLEGYLFPDTYRLTKPVSANALVQSMLDNFAAKINSTDIVQGFAAQGLTLHQGVTLASIVEREVTGDEDRRIVAQLYLNRLKLGMPLQADPTILYAAETTGQQFNLKLNSPYNTYLNNGLPPGPICNPGLSSMTAVAHPQPNDYLYFVSDKTGKNHFAKTFAEHQKNVDSYLK